MANRIHNLIFIMGILSALEGCAIKVNVPVNRFDSPETIGKQWRVKLDAAVGGSNSVILTPDVTTLAPNPSSPLFERNTFLRIGGGVGLLDSLDIEIRNFDELQAKIQFWGEPRLTATTGNFAMAVTLAVGYDTENQNGTGYYSSDYTFKKDEYAIDTGVVAGYRIANWVEVYGGPFYHAIAYTGSYTLSNSPASNSPFSGRINGYGAHLGFEFGNSLVQAKIEGAYGQVQSGALNTGQTYLGTQIAFNFGKH